MTPAFDVLVVGGGMAGLSTAYYLRDSGLRVAVLERDSVGTRLGSSWGESRMYREMYSDAYYCQRAQEANELWRRLEQDHGVTLRRQHGLLFYGESWDEETIEGSIPGARRVMDEQGIAYEPLTAEEIRGRFPLTPDPAFTGLFEPTAGAVLADRVLQLFREEAARHGVRVVENAEVMRLESRSDVTLVHVAGSEPISAGRVVLSAGPWTNRLLAGLGVELDLELWSLLWAHYLVEPALASQYPQWFCFQREKPETDDGGLYYGFPSFDGERIKVGIDWCPPELRCRDMRAFRWDPAPALVRLLDAFLRANLRGVVRRSELQTSPYTMTRDVDFVLDRVPGHDRVCLFSGGSGQAFKFAPLIGRALADLALGRAPSTDVSRWSATRSAVQRPTRVQDLGASASALP